MPADRLDHLDRCDPIILVALVAIILQPDLDLIAKAGVLDASLRKVALLFADGESDHLSAIGLGGIFRKATPAASDLQQFLAAPQIDRFGKPAVFLVLRGRQIGG